MHYKFGRAAASAGGGDSCEPPREFWIDVGGTFTDCVAPGPQGSLRRFKILSTGAVRGVVAEGSFAQTLFDPRRGGDPVGFWTGWRIRLLDPRGEAAAEARVADSRGPRLQLDTAPPAGLAAGQAYELRGPEEAPLTAIRYLLGLPLAAPLPRVVVRLGTTRGTNALLTRSGARTAWVATRGFRDAPLIGYQSRPRLFDLAIRKPAPLHAAALEIEERLSAAGDVLERLDEASVRAGLEQLRDEGVEALAICLLHGSRYPEHERLVADIAASLGFRAVSASHQVSPLGKLVARGDTTLVDAYLTPVLREYVERLTERLGAAELWAMTSAGSLVAAPRFGGKDCILSGPAGGVVGLARVAEAAGLPRVIGFDMGGTSTDVSRYEGRLEREFETEKAGVRICAPVLAIETVAAGGGSICRFDGVKLVVGPESAGADPGPACYGRAGPLTVTDVNLFLGRIWQPRFPFELDRRAVVERLDALRAEMAETGASYALEELAAGLLRVANATMAHAVRSVSIARGYDPREYALAPFGGAAGQHACAVARDLGIGQVLCHADAGLLSALGVGLAERAAHRAAPVYEPYSEALIERLASTWTRLEDEALDQLRAEGGAPDSHETRRALELRYLGVEAALLVDEPRAGTYAEAFAAEHRRRFGFDFEGRALEVVAARLDVVARRVVREEPRPPFEASDARPSEFGQAWFGGRVERLPVYEREHLRPGQRLAGPALVVEPASTTIVEPGWRGEVLPGGVLLLTDEGGPPAAADPAREDPVLLEVFNQHFAAIAREMGHTLRQTSVSVNIKERLDFSCALFTAAGDLVVNAPHIPVHLGAMSETVRALKAELVRFRAGDVLVTNDPYHGGSHLPDVTVVTPVVDERGGVQFFVASRAHHAEIGGAAPGSMPPFSRTLAEEGVVIGAFRLVDAGQPRFDELERLLGSGPHPSRAPADNLADIAAQVAANQQGVRDLQALVARHGWPTVSAYMGHIQRAAERKTRQALVRLRPGRYERIDHLDDGTPIAVAVTLAGDEARVDFTGSGPVSPSNFNAPPAIVRAAVLYVLRLLLAEDVPLNEGVLAPVRIVLPAGVLNPGPGPTPDRSPAVAAGNVETSQRVVDVLLGALGLAAASQGTMNNVLVGDDTFGYYETICGGSGATRQAAGADAVQTHMTNTRLTDPEVLESRYPLRVREFAVRRGSGGAGAQRGGDGARRVLEFTRPLRLSLVTSRRGPYLPFGLQGGQPGAAGRNQLVRADGQVEELPACASLDVAAGERLVLETPGGGGFGPSAEASGRSSGGAGAKRAAPSICAS